MAFFAHLGRFFRVWGCSWLVFSSPRERWGSIFEVKALTFSMFFRCARVRCASCVEHGLLQAPPCKTTQNTMRNACRSFRPIRRERPKNNFQRVWSTIRRRWRTQHAKFVLKIRLGARQTRFGKGLGSSLACLGRVLATLVRFWGAPGPLLGASGALLGASWSHQGAHGRPQARF